MAFFFMKLIPPRATFPHDASEEELAAMSRHADYVKQLIEKDIVVAAGPVMEGEGAWGMAIVNVDTEANANAIGDADPIVQSAIGFRWDVLPMGSLLYKHAT